MADPLAQAFADLPESSESEGEQSDAQSSEEEEELDSEEEAVKKLEAKRKRKAAKREKKAAAKAPDLGVPPADFDGPGDLGSSFAMGDVDEEPVEAADFNKYSRRRGGGRGGGRGGRGGPGRSGRGWHKRQARAKARAGDDTGSKRPRKRNRIVETQVVEHENFKDPTERDLFPREFARV